MFDLIKDKHCYILTDSNFDLLQVEKSPECSNYLDLCISNGFMNLITKATRFTSHSNTLIDQIFCNINLNSPESGVLLSDLSDHLPCFTSLNLKNKVKSEQKFTEFRDFSEFNINLFRENLSNLSWDDVCSCSDPLESFDLFWNSWSTLYNLHFPVKKSKFNKNFHKIQDFISKGLLTSRRTKLSLYQDYLSSRNPQKFEIYKNYRNLYNKLIREAKKLYNEKKLNLSKNCPKKMWGFLYEAIDEKSTKSSKISMIKSKGLSITEPSKIADTFNSFFSEIADEIRSQIPDTSAKPEDYLEDLDSNFEILSTNPVEVSEIISSLNRKNTLDIDCVSTVLIKAISTEISEPLSHIFNLSFSTYWSDSDQFKSGKSYKLSSYFLFACIFYSY